MGIFILYGCCFCFLHCTTSAFCLPSKSLNRHQPKCLVSSTILVFASPLYKATPCSAKQVTLLTGCMNPLQASRWHNEHSHTFWRQNDSASGFFEHPMVSWETYPKSIAVPWSNMKNPAHNNVTQQSLRSTDARLEQIVMGWDHIDHSHVQLIETAPSQWDARDTSGSHETTHLYTCNRKR